MTRARSFPRERRRASRAPSGAHHEVPHQYRRNSGSFLRRLEARGARLHSVGPPPAASLGRSAPRRPADVCDPAPAASSCRPGGRVRLWCIQRRRDRSPASARHVLPRETPTWWRSLRPAAPTQARPPPPGETAIQRDGAPLLVTSAPRGILNVNVLSAKPVFSLKFENWNVDRPPWLSAALNDRIWNVFRSITSCSQ